MALHSDGTSDLGGSLARLVANGPQAAGAVDGGDAALLDGTGCLVGG